MSDTRLSVSCSITKISRAYIAVSSFVVFTLSAFGMGAVSKGFGYDTFSSLYHTLDLSIFLVNPFLSAATVELFALLVSAVGIVAIMRESTKIMFLHFTLLLASMFFTLYIAIVCETADSLKDELNQTLVFYAYSVQKAMTNRTFIPNDPFVEDQYVRDHRHVILRQTSALCFACVFIQIPTLVASAHIIGLEWILINIQIFFNSLSLALGTYITYLAAFSHHLQDTTISQFVLFIGVFVIFKALFGFFVVAKPQYRRIQIINLFVNSIVIVLLTTSTAITLVSGSHNLLKTVGLCAPNASNAATTSASVVATCEHAIVIDSFLKQNYFRISALTAVSVVALTLNFAANLYNVCVDRSRVAVDEKGDVEELNP
jgi:hypothetical protein